MQNYWQPPLLQNQEGEHKAPLPGRHLRDYGQQPQQVNQFSPLAPADGQPVTSLSWQTGAKQWRMSPTLRITRRIRRRHQRWQGRRSIGMGILIAFTLLAVIGASSGIASAYSYYQSQLPRVQGSVFHCTPGRAQLDYDPATKKHDPCLALARASLLAGMPQDPPDYDPTQGPSHKQLALRRQDYVLNQMMRYGITVDGIGAITPAVIKKTEQMTAKMTFTQPPGLHIACVSSQTGLQAPGTTSSNCDWVLDGQDPMQPGVVQTAKGKHGNGNGHRH